MAMYSVRVPDDIDLKSRIAALAREREPQWQTLVRALDALQANPPINPQAGPTTTAPELAARLQDIERRLAALEQAAPGPGHQSDTSQAPVRHPSDPASAAIDPRERDKIIHTMANQTPRPTNPEIGKAVGCSEATVRRILKNRPQP